MGSWNMILGMVEVEGGGLVMLFKDCVVVVG